ncbi:hypothetical protein LguiA_024506 [Lonicera macranthoides]
MAAKVAIVSVVLFLAVSCVSCNNTQHQEFTRCMSLVRKHLHSPASPQYSSIFFSSQQNRRWINSTNSKPAFIFAPKQEAEIQTAVLCSKTHGLQIRVKSGGHDYEGLSFFAQVPYIIIALDHFRDKIEHGHTTVKVAFTGQFLGRKGDLVRLMKKRFPELGVQPIDCNEFSWINATLSISSRAKTMEDLLKRIDVLRTNNKAKSDFVNKAMPEEALLGVWKRLMKEDQHDLYMIMDPFGGVNNEISESEIPFPHRKGTLYNIQYLINWNVSNAGETHKSIKSMRKLYKFMEPFVTHSPRAAYINYRDLDIGRNQPDGKATYSQARVWGEKYFKGNFARLVQIKSRVDRGNFFRNEQSIPVV